MSETEWLQAFLNDRSEEAFAQLVRRYAGLVYSVAKRRSNNAALAEDITQIVFIRFAKSPPALKTEAELAGWLHRTALNVTIDTWRSESRRRAREQQAAAMEPATSEDFAWEGIAPNLDEALNQLKRDDRQALLLRFFSGKNMRDVGAALGVGEDAAKMRVSRAVDRLRTQLRVGPAAGSAVLLGTMLAERSVEAAPVQLVSKLAAMKLPAIAGAAGVGGLLVALLRIPPFKLGVGTAVLGILALSIVHLLQSPEANNAALSGSESKSDPMARASGSVDDRLMAARDVHQSPMTGQERPPKVFQVVDAETGEALAGTKITINRYSAGGVGNRLELWTDEQGIVLMPEPFPGIKGINVFVVAEGHVPKSVSFMGPEISDYLLKLAPAITLGGLVVDELEERVSDVTVLVSGPSSDPEQMENLDFQTCPVKSGVDGRWSCPYIPGDTNEIMFVLKKEGFVVTHPVVDLPQVDRTNLVLVLNRGFTVTGRITDSDQHPIAGARIKTVPQITDQEKSTRTDEQGRFTLTGVAGDTAPDQLIPMPPVKTNTIGQVIFRGAKRPGPWHADLAAEADGFSPQIRRLKLINTTNSINFLLAPGKLFRGQVVDEAGDPIANALVQTDWNFEKHTGSRFEWRTKTDGDGRFEWNSAPTEDTCYWFEADGYEAIRGRSLAADGSSHEITLKRSTGK